MLARLSVLSLTLILLLLNPSTYASPIAINPAAIERRGGSSSSLSTADPLGSVLRDKWGTVKNNYPIILVHGFGGFGKPLLDGLNYFGGLFGDTQKHLESLGYTVYVADLGPVSSNWERACELYAQIKGTRVDYGKARSSTYGFSRYGRNFTGKGFMPDWGTRPDAKVNLLTHSMGGPTSAMMLQLLATGFQAEVDSTKDGSLLSELFYTNRTGGASKFVNSMFTLSAPHQGTTLDDLITSFDLTAALIKVLVGAANIVQGIYDIKLEHWGLRWNVGNESFDAFLDRLLASRWGSSPSTGIYDLSVTAPFSPINSWVKTQPDVYYFSSTNSATIGNPITLQHVPTLTANPVFQPFAILMGSIVPTSAQALAGAAWNWYANDGVVNSYSMTHPSTAVYDGNWGTNMELDDELDVSLFNPFTWFNRVEVPRGGRPVKGVYLGTGKQLRGDHLDVVGMFKVGTPKAAYAIARNAAAIMASTP